MCTLKFTGFFALLFFYLLFVKVICPLISLNVVTQSFRVFSHQHQYPLIRICVVTVEAIGYYFVL